MKKASVITYVSVNELSAKIVVSLDGLTKHSVEFLLPSYSRRQLTLLLRLPNGTKDLA